MKKVFESHNIVEFFKTKKEGDSVSYKDLQQFTHYDLNDYVGLQNFKKNTMSTAKNNLIEYGIVVKAIQNEGYYILKSNQIQSYAYRTYVKKPLKQLERSKRILEKTNMKKLNNVEIAKHNLTLELNNELLNNNNSILNSTKYEILKK